MKISARFQISVVAALAVAGLMLGVIGCGSSDRGTPQAGVEKSAAPAGMPPSAAAATTSSPPAPPAGVTVQTESVSSQAVDNVKPSPEAAVLDKCLVSLIEEAQVPGQEAGVLVKLIVREGAEVKAGDELAQIDDVKTQMEVRVATAKHEAAKAKAEDDINIRYATASYQVALAEYKANLEAVKNAPGAVPRTELERLRLKTEETRLAIDKARLEQRVASEEAKQAQAEVDAAKENINRRRIRSPLDGVVVDLHRHLGEWVQPGDAVFHVIRMDHLFVEGYVNAKDYSPNQLRDREATVTVNLAGGRELTLTGKIIFVKPLMQGGGSSFLVKAAIENQREDQNNSRSPWVVSPGLTAKMTVPLK